MTYSKNCPMFFGFAHDILLVGYDRDGTDHHYLLSRVLKICKKENSKFNLDRFHFRCMNIPLFGEIVSMCAVQSNPCKLYTLRDMPHLSQKRVSIFFEVMNYLSKYSLAIFEVFKTFRRLTSVKNDWTLNRSYQKLYE